MPGYDLKVDGEYARLESLLCIFCGLILKDAIQTGEGLRFCKSCWEKIEKFPELINNKELEIDFTESIHPDIAVRRAVDRIPVKCYNYENGCPWTGSLKDHERDHKMKCQQRGTDGLHSISQYSGLLEEALKEGHVIVKWSKYSVLGPPGSGKSSLMYLLHDEESPIEHHSTPVSTEPQVRQLNTISSLMKEDSTFGQTSWDMIDRDTMKEMVATEIKTFWERRKTPRHVVSSSTGSSKDSIPSASRPPLPSSSMYQVAVNMVELDSSDNATSHFKKRPCLSEVHWIYGVDSGGQAAFLDIAPALLRYNSVNMFTHKLNESLQDTPRFFFSVHGEQVGQPIQRQMTHLQLLQASIRSLASVAPPHFSLMEYVELTHASHPIFIVLGTFLDKIGQESLEDKNKVLWTHFEQYIDDAVLKCYREELKSVIYPVTATDRGDEAKAIAQELRSATCQRYIQAKIPARWFMFQLELERYRETNHSSIISKDMCIQIGHSVRINEKEVEGALLYYNDLTIFLYFPHVLPHVVFLHPQPLFDKLSDLIAISFADTILQLRKLNISIPDSSHIHLKKEGKFDSTLLKHLEPHLQFSPEFTISNFLSLMKYLLVIAPLPEEGQYFLPCVLPTCSLPELYQIRQTFLQRADCQPLVLTWGDIIPQGLFPALVVSLLKATSHGFHLVTKPLPYRNSIILSSFKLGIKLLLVDATRWLEVHCTGPTSKCSIIRALILKGITIVADRFHCLSVSSPQTVFLCDSTFGDHICYPNEEWSLLTCDNGDCRGIVMTEMHSCWFPITIAPTITAPPVHTTLASCHFLPANGQLGEKHASIILSTIKSIVNWEILGIFLGLECSILNQIKRDHFHQTETCRAFMILHWINGGAATCDDLYIALGHMGENRIVTELKQLPTQ